MPILPRTLPTAGPFQLGHRRGRVLIVTHRRWFPAILCWVLAGVVSLWVLAGVFFPKSEFVPEPDYFANLLGIASAIAVAGVVVALWRRTFLITDEFIRSSAGFPKLAHTTLFRGETYTKVHPVITTLQAKVVVTWEGFAVVVHTSEEDGAIIAAFVSELDAFAHAEHIADEMNIRSHAEIGVALNTSA
ncbi:MAG: hypothetical protein ACREJD_04720 [Phycisphaerales bacterium]